MTVSDLAKLLMALPEEYRFAPVLFSRHGADHSVNVVVVTPEVFGGTGPLVELMTDVHPDEPELPDAAADAVGRLLERRADPRHPS